MTNMLSKYHKEYSSNPQIVENEKSHMTKRKFRNRKLWATYLLLLFFSAVSLPAWMTFLLCLQGIILLPTAFSKKTLRENPFLVVDSKYLQYKGKIISWNTISKITIGYEAFKKKDFAYNFTISLKYHNGKEIDIDTCYFENQEEIIGSIFLLAEFKGITIENNSPNETFRLVN